MIHEFNVNGVNYIFNSEFNEKIPNFNWFMECFPTSKWETDTFNIFNLVKNSEKTALDIGAWIGPTSIWLSKNFKNVISIEPDKEAVFSLKNNLITNNCENVTILEKALTNSKSKEIYFGQNDNTEFDNLSGPGDSKSQSKLNKTKNDDYLVKTININEILNSFNDISFIKVDIEGGEEDIFEELIKASSNYNIKVWISFHYEWWKDKNIERFNNIIDIIKFITFDSIKIDKYTFFEKVKEHPFGSFLLEF